MSWASLPLRSVQRPASWATGREQQVAKRILGRVADDM
jgi:hypothetical protein